MSAGVRRPVESDEYYFEEGCHILEILPASADPDLSIARARVAPGERTRLHRLRDTTERYLILAGEGRVSLGREPFQSVLPGDVVVIPPMTPQSIENTGSGDLVFLAVCSPGFTHDIYEDIDAEADGLPEPGSSPGGDA